MYFFTPELIAQANQNIESLDPKVGGLMCLLHCLTDDIEENVSYTINGEQLRKQLSFVFDKEPKFSFEGAKSSYVIFAKDWSSTFFDSFIKNRIDLLSCAIFFLRRCEFEREYTKEEVVDLFIKRFNLTNVKDRWFYNSNSLALEYNQDNVEDNQSEFYIKMGYVTPFKSILFRNVIQKSAADIKAAGQIQTLYSGSGIHTCLLLSDEPLEQYYVMKNSNQNNASQQETPTCGTNIILYGVPGCGKSHTIKNEYCNDKKYMERVVFHPDYTYSDFIGQILPAIDKVNGEEKISYKFTAGPFTKILKDAITDDEGKMHYLVIEEINRGNAPAIFGEVFQLLDRENGESEYGITNFDIADYVYGDKEQEIKIPRNLTILATMNTADQNVFTLDTAFKRRWIMRSIKNDIANCDHATECITGTNVTWYAFAKKINDLIIDFSDGNLSSEDNRLGAYFVKSDDLKSRKTFGEKVLMYLWNDAFKYNRPDVFNSEYKTLEDLLDGFVEKGFAVFNSNLQFDEYVEETTKVDESEYLDGKSQTLVDLYSSIRDAVKDKIENLYTYTVPSKSYIGMGSDDNPNKKTFTQVSFKADGLSFELEKPRDEQLANLGEEIAYNGRHCHYFKIFVTADDDINNIVNAIFDSYEQLKGQ